MSRRLGVSRLVRRAAAVVPGGVPLQGGAVRSRYDQLQPLPTHPPDWQTGPPDFVIIGAQKSGTTWWQGLVESHLQIVRPPGQRRELHFFDHFWDRWPSEEQFEHYKRYFPRPSGSLVGEKTPGYLYQPWVAPMLAHVAPEAKLIVLMRDPVERFISGLGLLQRSGSLKGEVGAGEVGLREHRIVEAIDRSRYADQLAWWVSEPDRGQASLQLFDVGSPHPRPQIAERRDLTFEDEHRTSRDLHSDRSLVEFLVRCRDPGQDLGNVTFERRDGDRYGLG